MHQVLSVGLVFRTLQSVFTVSILAPIPARRLKQHKHTVLHVRCSFRARPPLPKLRLRRERSLGEDHFCEQHDRSRRRELDNGTLRSITHSPPAGSRLNRKHLTAKGKASFLL